MEDRTGKSLISAISSLSSKISDLTSHLKKQPKTVNNVYVTVDSDAIVAQIQTLFDEYASSQKPQTVNISQHIHNPDILDPIEELTEAIRLTLEYTGNDVLPAVEGWSWYDALVKYAPEKALRFKDDPIQSKVTPKSPPTGSM